MTAGDIRKDGITLTVEPSAGGEATKIEADVALVAVGRRARTEDLGLHKVGDGRGILIVVPVLMSLSLLLLSITCVCLFACVRAQRKDRVVVVTHGK